MVRKLCYFFLFISILSCEKENQFYFSKPNGNLILIKNPSNDSINKKNIIRFFNENLKRYDNKIIHFSFYRYTSDTKPFLENRGDYSGGFSSNEMSQYDDTSLIAYFEKTKCKNDSTKIIGILHYYGVDGLKSNKKGIDTIIGSCN